jgi:hypothetical protein
MRINVYAEEMTDQIEIVSKKTGDGEFTGVRFYLHLPVTLPSGEQAQGPFMHRTGDDDSSAVTFWGKRDLRDVLRKALDILDRHYAQKTTQEFAIPPGKPLGDVVEASMPNSDNEPSY